VSQRRANRSLGFGGLFRGALEVGHDHIAATVKTLVFAYAGSGATDTADLLGGR
jgi:uncharacterized membrane protein